MKSVPLIKKQVLVLLVFSFFASIIAIVHGIFFDLDFQEIKRLTLEGIVLTLLIVFPALLFLEWIFDVNNRSKFDDLEKKISKLKKKG